jgi:hypothetical protein
MSFKLYKDSSRALDLDTYNSLENSIPNFPWEILGNTLYYSGGPVGINTNTVDPYYAFRVRGVVSSYSDIGTGKARIELSPAVYGGNDGYGNVTMNGYFQIYQHNQELNTAVLTQFASDNGSNFVNNGGNFGIGTTSPDKKLTVFNGEAKIVTTGSIRPVLTLDSSSSNEQAQIILKAGSAGNGSRAARVDIINAKTNPGVSQWLMINDYSQDETNELRFINSNSNNVVTMTQTGRVGINQTNPTYDLQLGNDSAAKPSTNTWTTVSDARIKQNIQPANLQTCWDTIKKLQLKRYKWNDAYAAEHNLKDRNVTGWIAQEVKQLIPKAVEINPLYKTVKEVDEDGNASERQEIVYNDFHTLNADEIYKAMYGALQLAIQRIEMLEKKVNA